MEKGLPIPPASAIFLGALELYNLTDKQRVQIIF